MENRQIEREKCFPAALLTSDFMSTDLAIKGVQCMVSRSGVLRALKREIEHANSSK